MSASQRTNWKIFPVIGSLVDAKDSAGHWYEAVVLASRVTGDQDAVHYTGPLGHMWTDRQGGEGAGAGASGGDDAEREVGDLIAGIDFYVHFKGWSSDWDCWVRAPESMAPVHTRTRQWRGLLQVGDICEANFGLTARGSTLWHRARVANVSKGADGRVCSVRVRYAGGAPSSREPDMLEFWLDVNCDKICELGTHLERAGGAQERGAAGAADAAAQSSAVGVERCGGLAMLRDSGTLTDLSIRAGERDFRVHKCVLAARSSVFRSMFTLPTSDADAASVNLQSISADTFAELLHFVYTGAVRVPARAENVPRLSALIVAADRYDVAEMSAAAEEILCNCITVQNVVRVIALARRFALRRLQAAAHGFFAAYAVHVLEGEDFGALLTHVPLEIDGDLRQGEYACDEYPVKVTHGCKRAQGESAAGAPGDEECKTVQPLKKARAQGLAEEEAGER